jgi:hypothetical protein
MRCYYHPTVEAVAGCKNCSRGLCMECAVDVGNGLACRARCETEVRALNEIIQRNKTAHQKTQSAYVRTAIFYGGLGGLCLLAGVLDWRGFGWVLTPAGLVFLFAAWLHYSTGRKFERE